MYTRVYAKSNGEPFDVTRERADFLILMEGWTQTPPEEPAAQPVAEPEVAEDDVEVTKPRKTNRKRVTTDESTDTSDE